MTLPTGSRLGPYEILSPLGAGSMGAAWKTRDGNVILARHGQHYVYRLRRVLSELNVVEGLR